MNIVILGPPGSGKGTQAGEISRKLKITHIASGDLFRDVSRRGDDLGNKLKSYMDKGLLVPDDITIKMILERIEKSDCKDGFMLDGFPRTLEQAQALDEALSKQGDSIGKAIYINVAAEELVRRLSSRFICRKCQMPYNLITAQPKIKGKCDECGGDLYQRDDDKPDTVRKRIDVYVQSTSPLIEYYNEKGKLAEIDGEQEISDITDEIIRVLSEN